MKITLLFVAILSSSSLLAMDTPVDPIKLGVDLLEFQKTLLVQNSMGMNFSMLNIAKKYKKKNEYNLVHIFSAQFERWLKENKDQEQSLLIFAKAYYGIWIADQAAKSVYDFLNKIKVADNDPQATQLFDLLCKAAPPKAQASKSKKGLFSKKNKNEYMPVINIASGEDDIFAHKIIALIARYYYDLAALEGFKRKK